MNNPAPASDRALLLPSWAAADALGQITLLSLPFMLGMLVEDLGLGPADAGLLLSVELCTISVVCMALSPLLGRLPRRSLALCGVAVAVVGNFLSMRSHDFAPLMLARAATGVGYGFTTAAGNATVAAAREPARLYDNKMMLFAVTQLLVDLCEPSLISHLGPRGFFGAMIALNLIVTPLILRLPQSLPEAVEDTVGGELSLHNRSGKLASVLVLAVAVLFAIRESSYWGFAERFGAAVSVDGALVGLMLAIGTVPSVIAPKIATKVRDRFGEIGPMVAGIVVEGAVLWLIGTTTSRRLFLLLLLVWPVFYCYAVPLLMGVAARLDRQGRVIALTAGALQLAFAIGPAVAGAVVQRINIHGLSFLSLVSTFVLTVLTLYLPRRPLERPATAAPG